MFCSVLWNEKGEGGRRREEEEEIKGLGLGIALVSTCGLLITLMYTR